MPKLLKLTIRKNIRFTIDHFKEALSPSSSSFELVFVVAMHGATMLSAGAYSFLVQLIRRSVLVKIRVVPGVTLSAVRQTAPDRKQIFHEGRSFTTGRNDRENPHVFCRRGKHIFVNMKMNKKIS